MPLEQNATILAVATAAACVGYYIGKSASLHQTNGDKGASSPGVCGDGGDGGDGDGEDIDKFINTSDDCKMVLYPPRSMVTVR